MTENQYKLCIEILSRFDKAGILKNIVLIGSWCIPFYKNYFGDTKYLQQLKTRDVDFLVPEPHKIIEKVDIPKLLKDLGFVIGFKGQQGYIKLEHPDLIVEFLVPEKGRGIKRPVPLPMLGLNAQALRYLNFLTGSIITLAVEGMQIRLPHPVNFAFHKLIIYQLRGNPEKAKRDRETALRILEAVVEKGEKDLIQQTFEAIPVKWQKKILTGLQRLDHPLFEDLYKNYNKS